MTDHAHKQSSTPPTVPGDRAPTSTRDRQRGLLAGLRIRKKLMLLHTLFSLTLALVLLLPLRPALRGIVHKGEQRQAEDLLAIIAEDPARAPALNNPEAGITLSLTDADAPGAEAALASPGAPVPIGSPNQPGASMLALPSGELVRASVTHDRARREVLKVYILMTAALFAVYALVALALEIFILPQHVYGPIRRMLRADRAVQEGDQESELIEERHIPADELGEIMRSRNESIRSLRTHESDLADALDRFETLASDLRRKNHMLETARRNLEGADRLASLGMMSAGIAHELNTPLAVAKGMVEKLDRDPAHTLSDAESALLTRVVGRLERLSESLLDFARARPPESRPASPRQIVDEAFTLVRLDRDAGAFNLVNQLDEDLSIECDADRMVQVFVNLIRNAVDATRSRGLAPDQTRPRIEVASVRTRRDETDWLSVTITDNGPGIDPELLPRLFEPFVSTELDARGTGLGLAVAEGIVREHAGVILARNRPGRAGAVFEVMLPLEGQPQPEPAEDVLEPADRGSTPGREDRDA